LNPLNTKKNILIKTSEIPKGNIHKPTNFKPKGNAVEIIFAVTHKNIN
jgi:hypothetical protein